MDLRTHSTKLKLIFFCLSSLILATSCESDSPSSQTDKPTNSATISTQVNLSPSSGDRLISASIGDASNLIPMIAGDSASHEIASNLYLSMLKYDKDLNLTGELAENWEVSDDQLSIIFHLRHGINWTDGKPFTSQDCAFTLALMQDDATQSAYKSDYSMVKSFETPDPYTFTVHYSEIFSPALSSWVSLSILPKHIFKGENIMNTKLSRLPKATLGPYVLKDWQAQQSITLSANPNYYDGSVWISERMTRIIPDTATQFLELSAGHLDEMGLTPTQFKRLFDNTPYLKEHYLRYQYLGFVYTYMGFNLNRAPFNDPLVRQAIAYAIDRQEIVDGVLLGLGELIATPYKPGTRWVNESLKPRAFSPDKATKLLSQAGWQKNQHGILEKDGKSLSFTILTNNGNKQRADSATIIQQRLKQIGIEVKVRLVEWSAFIDNFINKRNFDAVILGWSMSPEPDQYTIWHSSQTAERQFNFLGYHNDVVDEALVKARQTFDQDARKAYYDKMQEEIFNDVPMVFLYAPYSTTAMHKRIKGIEPAPAGIGYNSMHWYIPKALQKYDVSAQASSIQQ
ncbi:MAG: peptide-binding protein [Zetaproteobacteria bacterium CG_4_9_14_3_um_filter_49_83]|nr:MAG: peptide-binding protein [Zetaproteobacteria bacterium CG1_02_49_23]PIQ33109.1 MAG: peptide-binding protein [Zetaproteobacteria bacterium CG17_big_fil_post_rev_8_21_14_2_50_50_13]PIV29151.1 MAG: peptide-binding protein [Zetaproteobacteria bacterium CG02_land_8_20_14_3_00_50_9]PIY55616.1 MAG: peptide-binding protein [Zetaproteobacteria bacterium CG_4_10_14_0_8_um_filter_49_80]PJA36424.1 MAG: peptide-binding protein [Zetaproteobacteria bacterium CG_4_9_14_3_um_filter_49_83]